MVCTHKILSFIVVWYFMTILLAEWCTVGSGDWTYLDGTEAKSNQRYMTSRIIYTNDVSIKINVLITWFKQSKGITWNEWNLCDKNSKYQLCMWYESIIANDKERCQNNYFLKRSIDIRLLVMSLGGRQTKLVGKSKETGLKWEFFNKHSLTMFLMESYHCTCKCQKYKQSVH